MQKYTGIGPAPRQYALARSAMGVSHFERGRDTLVDNAFVQRCLLSGSNPKRQVRLQKVFTFTFAGCMAKMVAGKDGSGGGSRVAVEWASV